MATDGSPLPEGQVVFSSESLTCSGQITDGQYKILYQGSQSVPLDEYVVTIFPPVIEVEYNAETDQEEPIPSSTDPALFPKKYQSKSTSGLKFTPERGNNTFDIKMDKEP